MNAETRGDLAKAILRVALGLTLMAHGTQKLFGWFGGGGIVGTGKGFHAMGFRPGEQHATLAGLIETGGGAAMALGLATPAAGASTAVSMGVAAGVQAAKGFFAAKGGLEYPATLGLMASTMALGGPGRFSLDAATGDVFDRPWMRVVGLSVVPVIVFWQLRKRRGVLRAEQKPASADENAPDRA